MEQEDYEHLSDSDLLREIDKAGLAAILQQSPEWKILREAGNRIVDRAVKEFAVKTRPDDLPRIIELQAIIKKYKFGLFNEVKLLAKEGEFLFEVAKRRDIDVMADD